MAPALPVFSPLPNLGWPVERRAENDIIPPTTTTGDTPTLVGRQAPETVTVVSKSGGGGGGTNLSGGAIAGIVIGSIAGFLLLCWVFRSCFNLGAPPQEREAWYQDAGEKRRRRRSRRRRGSSDVSVPPPVVVREHSRNHRRQPGARYVYTDGDTGRGRRYSREV